MKIIVLLSVFLISSLEGLRPPRPKASAEWQALLNHCPFISVLKITFIGPRAAGMSLWRVQTLF